MTKSKINPKLSGESLHRLPADFRRVLDSSPSAMKAWDEITQLARNEWICWIEDAKKEETRIHRIERAHNELMQGKRRPCCWAGCKHR